MKERIVRDRSAIFDGVALERPVLHETANDPRVITHQSLVEQITGQGLPYFTATEVLSSLYNAVRRQAVVVPFSVSHISIMDVADGSHPRIQRQLVIDTDVAMKAVAAETTDMPKDIQKITEQVFARYSRY